MEDYEKEYDIFEQIAEVIGREAAEKLFSKFEGRSLYFSKKISTVKKHQRLFDDFFEHNLDYSALSEKYNYTISHTRRLINDERRRRRKREKGAVSVF